VCSLRTMPSGRRPVFSLAGASSETTKTVRVLITEHLLHRNVCVSTGEFSPTRGSTRSSRIGIPQCGHGGASIDGRTALLPAHHGCCPGTIHPLAGARLRPIRFRRRLGKAHVLSSGRRRSPIWWMPIRIQATGMAVITIPSFQLGLHVCIQRVKGARHDHKGQIPKQHRHFCLLSVSAEQRHRGVGDIFPSLQTLRDPSIPLRNRSVRVRNIGLAGPGQLRVFLCLFPIALCSLRPAFHFNPPLICTL
jgi:hypothetical protein